MSQIPAATTLRKLRLGLRPARTAQSYRRAAGNSARTVITGGLLLLLLAASGARAQFVVHDPVLEATNIANHITQLARLVEQLQTMREQLSTAENTLAKIDLIEQYMGAPEQVEQALQTLKTGAHYYEQLRSLPADAALKSALALIEDYGKANAAATPAAQAQACSHTQLYGSFDQQTHVATPPSNAYAAQASWEQQFRYSEQRLGILADERQQILADMQTLVSAVKQAASENQRQDVLVEMEALKLAMHVNGIEQQQLVQRLDALKTRNDNELTRQVVGEAELYWHQLEQERQRRRAAGFNAQDLVSEPPTAAGQ